MIGALGALLRVALRFVFGLPLDGRPRTDATFTQPGTRSADPLRRPSRWAMLPGWKRAAWRLGAVAVAYGYVWGRLTHPAATGRVVAVAEVAGGLVAVVWLVAGARRWRLRTQVVDPLADVLRPRLGLPETLPARSFVRVPRTAVVVPPPAVVAWWRQSRPGRAVAGAGRRLIEGRELAESVRTWWLIRRDLHAERASKARPVRIALPATWPAADPAVVTVAASRLGGDEWAASWRLHGPKPELQLRVAPKPPGRAMWADYVAAVEMSGPTELMLGPTAGLRPVRVDLDSETPHVLLSMGTGAGKSVTAKTLGMQGLRKGWAAVMLDLKQESHPWAKRLIDAGVPGVTYCRKPAEVHDALLALDAERERRADARWEDSTVEFQRLLVFVEELNLTANALREYWQATKEKGQPNKSPALSALGNLTYAGRSVQIHVIAIGQMLTAQVFGGPEARENFGARILGRYSVNNWRMLVPEIPFARSSKIRGRVQVCIAGIATPTQVLYATDEEAVDYAAGGVDSGNPPGVIPFRFGADGSVPVPVSPDTPRTGSERAGDEGTGGRGTVGGDTPAEPAQGPSEPRRYTLAEAVALDVIDLGYEAAKKARQRDRARGRFPFGEEDRLTAEEWQQWAEARPRAVS